MKNCNNGDPSSTRGRAPRRRASENQKHPFAYVALGAIFLLAFFGFTLEPSSVSSNIFTAHSGLASSSLGVLRASEALVPETSELLLIEEGSVLAATPPGTVTAQVLGSLGGGLQQVRELRHYIVQEGETVSSLAKKFGITEHTVLWANELSSGAALREGQELIIMPVSGTLHLVRPHDTLSEIAGWYKANAEHIEDFNQLTSSSQIFAGDLLIIPGGTQPSSLPAGRLTPIENSYFSYPIAAPHRVTQGAHHYNAIDFSNGGCGEYVFAAAGGTVQMAGYHPVGGNYVRILHPNGVVTYYGHLAMGTTRVSPGQPVNRGAILGLTGMTGYATGCHVHFEVRGARNPFL